MTDHTLIDHFETEESGSSGRNDSSSSINSSGGDSMGSRENITAPQPMIATEKKEQPDSNASVNILWASPLLSDPKNAQGKSILLTHRTYIRT